LTRPVPVVVGSVLICAATLVRLPGLGGEFLPPLREGHFIVHTASLPGTSLQESLRLGTRLTERLLTLPGVESVSQWAGRAERGADTYGTHYSEYEVRLSASTAESGPEQQAALERIRDALAEFPGIAYEVNTFLVERVDETISGYTAPVVINLYGTDLERLDDKAREIAALTATIDGATDIQVRSPPGTPLAEIRFHHDQLASWGLRPLEIIESLETAYAGKTVGRYYEGNRGYDIAVILTPEQRGRIEQVGDLPLLTADGTLIKLRQVAEIRQTGGRYNILHQNAQRVQTITCGIEGRDPESLVDELRARIFSTIRFPADIYPDFAGSAVEQGAARQQLIVHSLLAAAGVALLIYLALGRSRLLLLTLLNLPFALAGGVAAAVGDGSVLSVGSVVGFVTLFGITVRNSIMLIAHYRHLVRVERRPWTLETAIDGAAARLPAILMTALVTALAMLPIAIGSDSPGREIMGPMAAIIVGGLFSSTALNLLVLPVVLWRWGRFDAERDTPESRISRRGESNAS
jgi:Cu/Ag efflux pump CusA